MDIFYDNIRKIDELLKRFSDKKIEDFFALIKSDNSLENYFLKIVDSVKWFYPLKERGYFDPKNIPIGEDGQSYYWNVLDYLERISLQITAATNQEYGKELLQIIENTVQYSRHKRKLNNYYIWWYFAKILNHLPNKLIADNVSIQQFKTWLLEWTSGEMKGPSAISDISENLLTKFLNKDIPVEFAEIIVGIITRIQSGDKKKPRRDEAVMSWSSYWILKGFTKNNEKIVELCSPNVIYDLVKKLKQALEYKEKEYPIFIAVKNDIYRIKLFRVNKDGLKDGEIEFKEGCLKVVIEKYDSGQIKDINTKEDLWKLHMHHIEPEKEVDSFILEGINNQKSFITKIKEKLPKTIKWESAENFDKSLSNLYEGLYEGYSHIWFRSLANSGSAHASNAKEVLTIILRDLLINYKKKDVIRLLKDFMSDKYQFSLFRRFALFLIDKNWEDYSSLWPEFIQDFPDMLSNSNYESELYYLLKNHVADFDKDTKQKLKELIDDIPDYYRKEGEKHEAYWKYRWLSPLKDDNFFTDLYKQYKQKAKPQDDKLYEPRSLIEGGMREVVHKTPLTKEEILAMNNVELIKYLDQFEGSDMWGSFEGKPDKRGLADTLQEAVKEKPEKFTDEMDLFENCPYLYVNSILSGLKDVWNSKRTIAWESILDFCKKYVTRDTFLQEAKETQGEDSGNGKYIWVVETIANLIEDGSRKDDWAFEDRYFDKVYEIFDKFLPLLRSDKAKNKERDAITYALNTTLGRVIEPIVIFSLHVARVKTKKGEDREKDWGKNRYERFFEKGIESYIWMGRFLPNMKYLDDEWTKAKIKDMNSRGADDSQWQCFMEGYLFGTYVYDDIYDMMVKNYNKTIENMVLDEESDKKLVQHITIGYLRGKELLQEYNADGTKSLFWEMLMEIDTQEKRGRWLEVVRFFWSITGRTHRRNKEEISKDFKTRIIDFWRWSHKNREGIVQPKLKDDYPLYLSHLADLTILLDNIDDEAYDWLMQSAQYIDLDHHTSFFFEYLTKFEDKESLKRIGKIFRKVLDHTTPTFKKEDIELIVKRLYDTKDKENKGNADIICNTYGRKGIHFLKDLYYKNNKMS